MVIRKEKEFIAPLVAAGRVAMTAAPMILGQKQSKESNKEMAKQTAAIKAQTRELKKLQKNPNVDPAQVGSVMSENQNSTEQDEKSFAMPGWVNGVKTVGRDLYNAANAGGINSFVKTQARNALIAGTAMYGVNKIIQNRIKKKNLRVNQSNGNLEPVYRAYSVMNSPPTTAQQAVQQTVAKKPGFWGKYGNILGNGTLTTLTNLPFQEATGLLLTYKQDSSNATGIAGATRRAGVRNRKRQKVYSNPVSSTVAPVVTTAATAAKKVVKDKAKKWFDPKRAAKYYGILAKRSMRDNFDTFKSHPLQTITGAANRFLSGFAGTKNVQGFAGSLANSTNKALAGAGKFMQNHKAVGNVAMAVPLAIVGKNAFKVARKGVDKVYRTLDPNAYKYSDAKIAQQKRAMQEAAQEYRNYYKN